MLESLPAMKDLEEQYPGTASTGLEGQVVTDGQGHSWHERISAFVLE